MGQNYSYEWDSKYCYPDSFVLRNKLNITDSEKLKLVEIEYTSLTIAEIKENPIKGNFDLRHLQDIHGYIFKDIYSWAGELRTVNIAKGSLFCNYMYIRENADRIFSQLKEECYLIGMGENGICDRLAYYLGEINALHPFREGNGRTQRVMIEYLAKVAGYTIDFSDISSTEMIEASVDAFNCDYDKMIKIFSRITKPIGKGEQEDFIKKIATPNSPIVKTYAQR